MSMIPKHFRWWFGILIVALSGGVAAAPAPGPALISIGSNQK
jgi:hypothetical protein